MTRQKNLLFLALLLFLAVGFYFLTLVRMGEQSEKRANPPTTPSTR